MPEYVLGFKEYYDQHPEIGRAVTDEFDTTVGSGTPAMKMRAQRAENGMLFYTSQNWVSFVKGPYIAAPTQPGTGIQVIDIRNQLPTAHPENVTMRGLAAISLLVVHWDGGPDPNVYNGYDPITYYKGEAQYHINKDWGGGSYGHGLMYHYKIDRAGKVYNTRSLQTVVWACNAANNFSVNVCVDATNGADANDAQVNALHSLAKWLFFARPDIPNLNEKDLAAHGELTQYGNSTECPGPKLRGFVHEYIGS